MIIIIIIIIISKGIRNKGSKSDILDELLEDEDMLSMTTPTSSVPLHKNNDPLKLPIKLKIKNVKEFKQEQRNLVVDNNKNNNNHNSLDNIPEDSSFIEDKNSNNNNNNNNNNTATKRKSLPNSGQQTPIGNNQILKLKKHHDIRNDERRSSIDWSALLEQPQQSQSPLLPRSPRPQPQYHHTHTRSGSGNGSGSGNNNNNNNLIIPKKTSSPTSSTPNLKLNLGITVTPNKNIRDNNNNNNNDKLSKFDDLLAELDQLDSNSSSNSNSINESSFILDGNKNNNNNNSNSNSNSNDEILQSDSIFNIKSTGNRLSSSLGSLGIDNKFDRPIPTNTPICQSFIKHHPKYQIFAKGGIWRGIIDSKNPFRNNPQFVIQTNKTSQVCAVLKSK